MQRERRGGLSGKARRASKRRRAFRLRARQHVDDYFDPDPLAPMRDRSIPIRGRSEFFPSADQPVDANTARKASHQLELPLYSLETSDDDAQSRGETTKRQAGTASEPSARPDVIRFPKRSAGEGLATLRPPLHYRRKGLFTWKGFLVGCAMGSAAAAFVLMVIQTAIN